MTEQELKIEISREYNLQRARNERLIALERKIKNGTATFAEVDEAAEVSGRIVAEAVWNHWDSFGSGGEMVVEDGTELFASSLTENHNYVTSLAKQVQKRTNELQEIGLAPVAPGFDRAIAKDVADKAEAGISEPELIKQCKTASRKTVDNFQKANAEAHAKAGLEVRVTRIYDGIGVHDRKDPCKFCIERSGTNMTYAKAIEKDAFRRHPGCGCTIVYTSAKGKTTTQSKAGGWVEIDNNEKKKLERINLDRELEQLYNNPPGQKSIAGLREIYARDVEQGWISALSGFDNYLQLYARIENEVVGLTTKTGLKVQSQSEHFLSRVIGTSLNPSNIHNGVYTITKDDPQRYKSNTRSGVSIEAIKEAITNGKPEKIKYSNGKPSQKYYGKHCDVSINPETGNLIQCNPRG